MCSRFAYNSWSIDDLFVDIPINDRCVPGWYSYLFVDIPINDRCVPGLHITLGV